MTPTFVIDTNVLAIGEGLNDSASDACVAACTGLMRRIAEGRATVVIDESDEILTEYLGVLGGARGSGLGTKLARLLRQRKYNAALCRRISITPCDEPPGSYEEVPEEVRNFDSDDQKFLAVSRADPDRPQIFAGLDEEWWCRRADLRDAGFDVQFPCSDDLMDLEC